MMKHTLPFLALTLLSFMACEKKATPSVYENCCGAEATADNETLIVAWPDGNGGTFDSTMVGQVYIPNIFTPGSYVNLYNSVFTIFGYDEAIWEIISAKHFCSCGALLFSEENFPPNDFSYSWDGKQSDGTYYQGGFDYEVKVLFINGLEKTYSGKACAFTCGDPGFPEERLPDCLFPNQNNGNGAPDNSLPMPSNCF